MQRIATMSYIKGNGSCKAFYDGCVDQEMERLTKMYRTRIKELEAMKAMAEKRNSNLIKHRIVEMSTQPHKNVVIHIREFFEYLWCLLCVFASYLGVIDLHPVKRVLYLETDLFYPERKPRKVYGGNENKNIV